MDTDKEKQKSVTVQSGGDAVYGIGLIGAWVYYFKGVTNFQEGLIAFFKGFAWPALLVYELLKFFTKPEEKEATTEAE